MTTVLFLCTANYYRSRLAEEIFNHMARKENLDAQAISAGIQADQWRSYNPGPISRYTLEALERFGIPRPLQPKDPDSFTPAIFEKADRIIALSRGEHKPMIETDFPSILDLIEFWDVEDLHLTEALPATDAIRVQVLNLLKDYRK